MSKKRLGKAIEYLFPLTSWGIRLGHERGGEKSYIYHIEKGGKGPLMGWGKSVGKPVRELKGGTTLIANQGEGFSYKKRGKRLFYSLSKGFTTEEG